MISILIHNNKVEQFNSCWFICSWCLIYGHGIIDNMNSGCEGQNRHTRSIVSDTHISREDIYISVCQTSQCHSLQLNSKQLTSPYCRTLGHILLLIFQFKDTIQYWKSHWIGQSTRLLTLCSKWFHWNQTTLKYLNEKQPFYEACYNKWYLQIKYKNNQKHLHNHRETVLYCCYFINNINDWQALWILESILQCRNMLHFTFKVFFQIFL